jgi:hypothetical protein
MKKRLLIAVLATATISLNSCKKDEPVAIAKIDFTQSYENAALALATAQKNYDAAVASNVPERIETATIELQSAQDKYIESKNTYIAKGGTVKSEYESYLKTSSQTLKNLIVASGSKTIQTAGKVVNGAINTTGKIATGTVNTVNSVANDAVDGKLPGKVINTAENVVQRTGLDGVAKTAESGVKSTVNTTATGIKKTSTEVKKTADQGISKMKEGINSIF